MVGFKKKLCKGVNVVLVWHHCQIDSYPCIRKLIGLQKTCKIYGSFFIEVAIFYAYAF